MKVKTLKEFLNEDYHFKVKHSSINKDANDGIKGKFIDEVKYNIENGWKDRVNNSINLDDLFFHDAFNITGLKWQPSKHQSNSIEMDVKMYNVDQEAMHNDGDIDADLQRDLEISLSRNLSWCGIDCKKDYSFEGRSGGWLVLNLSNISDISDIANTDDLLKSALENVDNIEVDEFVEKFLYLDEETEKYEVDYSLVDDFINNIDIDDIALKKDFVDSLLDVQKDAENYIKFLEKEFPLK